LLHPKDISINDFIYDLPQEKIAVYPLEQRDESKLLVYRNGEIKENRFKNLDSFLEKNSLLVFNNTKVIRARLHFLNEKGQPIEIFCLEPNSQTLEVTQAMSAQKTIRWNCLVGNLKRWKSGKLMLSKNGTTLFAELIERHNEYVLVEFSWEPAEMPFSEVLEITGNTPIPPYLKRESERIDRDRYQTVYAREEGSVAAPTAGLHFTDHVLEKLKKKSIYTLPVTLHVGAGTFKPVKAGSMLDHEMHAEWIEISVETLKELGENTGKNIIAVGTTSLRTVESLYWMGVKAYLNKNADIHELEVKQWEAYDLSENTLSAQESIEALLGWMKSRKLKRLICRTQILIAPPYELKIFSGIITNFHQPQSTLLLLVSAIVGEKWREIYNYALDNDFRFLSYGDSSLLLK
jgi:S-adenosylmethionine:tRNA ribosyltransferase-isomerase